MNSQKRLVVDANSLLRAVFGTRVRRLFDLYEGTCAFYVPALWVTEARKYIPGIASKRRLDVIFGLDFVAKLIDLVEIVDISLHEIHEAGARERMASRDITDWPIAATALLLDCPVWTEDQGLFRKRYRHLDQRQRGTLPARHVG